MGLDINVLSQPMQGYEREFEEIWKIIHDRFSKDEMPQSPYIKAKSSRFFGMLNSPIEVDKEGAISRFQEISIPAYASINAPVVGEDKDADAWVRDAWKNGLVSAESEDHALQNFIGYCALQVMDDCDGFPTYSNGYSYEGVDRTSFRGSFLQDCESLLSGDQIAQAWEPMLCKDFAIWGQDLRSAADCYAQENDLQYVLGKKQPVDNSNEGPCHELHIVDQAARWIDFWSKRGHGSDPYF